jgi:hypothetical protein
MQQSVTYRGGQLLIHATVCYRATAGRVIASWLCHPVLVNFNRTAANLANTTRLLSRNRVRNLRNLGNQHRTSRSRDNAPDLYSGGAQFTSRPGHRIWSLSWLFLSPSMKIPGYCYHSFLPNPFHSSSFIYHHSTLYNLDIKIVVTIPRKHKQVWWPLHQNVRLCVTLRLKYIWHWLYDKSPVVSDVTQRRNSPFTDPGRFGLFYEADGN